MTRIGNKERDKLKLDSIGLITGETSREISCPSCGVVGDFSVTRIPNGLLFNCYRASCGVKGFIPSKGSLSDVGKELSKTTEFNFSTRLLGKKEFDFFFYKYGITEEDLNRNKVVWSDDLNQVIFPCFNEDGKVWGYVGRGYNELAYSPHKNKQLYRVSIDTKCSWVFSDIGVPSDLLVLVEDCVSAIRLSTYFNTIALLGHSVPLALWDKISSHNVVIALDADVSHKANRILKESRMYVKKLCLVHLENDIKDMTEKQLARVIEKIERFGD